MRKIAKYSGHRYLGMLITKAFPLLRFLKDKTEWNEKRIEDRKCVEQWEWMKFLLGLPKRDGEKLVHKEKELAD